MKTLKMPLHWMNAFERAIKRAQFNGLHIEGHHQFMDITEKDFTITAYLTDAEILQIGVYIGGELLKEDLQHLIK
jgi:uncharacterized protein (DUF2344 family)